MEERLLHAAKAKESLGTSIPWIVDTMDNKLKHAMGDRNNSEFIVDPDGKIVRMRDWSNPELVRNDLKELVGPIDNPTDPRSLNLRINFAPTEVARGVVERVQRTGRMVAIKVNAEASMNPTYIKLRAEADSNLMTDGSGKLYLGFFVDPLHHVHWNNQAGPMTIKVNGKQYTGPKVANVNADADPREFVVDVTTKQPVKVTLSFVACDDEETWCRPLTQYFVVSLEADPDAGRVSGRGRFGGRRGGFGIDRRPGGRPNGGR